MGRGPGAKSGHEASNGKKCSKNGELLQRGSFSMDPAWPPWHEADLGLHTSLQLVRRPLVVGVVLCGFECPLTPTSAQNKKADIKVGGDRGASWRIKVVGSLLQPINFPWATFIEIYVFGLATPQEFGCRNLPKPTFVATLSRKKITTSAGQ